MEKRKEQIREVIKITMIIFVIILVISFPIIKSFFEAKSYRKFCKTNVTTWDALWLDLRIDECRNDKRK